MSEERFKRIEEAISRMAWGLAKSNTGVLGFSENDARRVEILLGNPDFVADEYWLVKSEGKPGDRSLAYWGPYASENSAQTARIADEQTVVVHIPASKKIIHGTPGTRS